MSNILRLLFEVGKCYKVRNIENRKEYYIKVNKKEFLKGGDNRLFGDVVRFDDTPISNVHIYFNRKFWCKEEISYPDFVKAWTREAL